MEQDPHYFSEAWWTHTYAARGRYAEQLERWYAAFPRERLLVLFNDELSRDPEATYARVLEFLGAEPHELASYPRIYDREYEPMRAETRARLRQEFEEPDARLAELLGRELPWRSGP
jgi:hypothetical protein